MKSNSLPMGVMPVERKIGKKWFVVNLTTNHYEQTMNFGKRKKGIDKSGNVV